MKDRLEQLKAVSDAQEMRNLLWLISSPVLDDESNITVHFSAHKNGYILFFK